MIVVHHISVGILYTNHSVQCTFSPGRKNAGCQLEASTIVIVRRVCIGVQKQQHHLNPCAMQPDLSLFSPCIHVLQKKSLEIIFTRVPKVHTCSTKKQLFFLLELCMTMLIVARAKTASMQPGTVVEHEHRLPGQLKRHSRQGSEEAPAAEGSASLESQTKKSTLTGSCGHTSPCRQYARVTAR